MRSVNALMEPNKVTITLAEITGNRDLVGDPLGFFDNAPQKLAGLSTTLFDNTNQSAALLQLCVLRFCLLVDWDVRVGIFPQGEEVFICGERPDAGGIGVSTL